MKLIDSLSKEYTQSYISNASELFDIPYISNVLPKTLADILPDNYRAVDIGSCDGSYSNIITSHIPTVNGNFENVDLYPIKPDVIEGDAIDAAGTEVLLLVDGIERERVAAEIGKLTADRGRKSLQHRHHGDDGHRADEDAERREKAAQPVGVEACEGRAECFAEHVQAARAGFCVSSTIRPSNTRMVRRQCAAMSGSCVTTITVCP